MKLSTLLLALALAALAFQPLPSKASAEQAAQATAGGQTLEGEVLDLACYLVHSASGPEHAPCALKCVKSGQPMGLLTEDGSVYLLYASHTDASAFDAAKEFAGKRVTITGKMAEQAGMTGIEVATVTAKN